MELVKVKIKNEGEKNGLRVEFICCNRSCNHAILFYYLLELKCFCSSGAVSRSGQVCMVYSVSIGGGMNSFYVKNNRNMLANTAKKLRKSLRSR